MVLWITNSPKKLTNYHAGTQEVIVLVQNQSFKKIRVFLSRTIFDQSLLYSWSNYRLSLLIFFENQMVKKKNNKLSTCVWSMVNVIFEFRKSFKN